MTLCCFFLFLTQLKTFELVWREKEKKMSRKFFCGPKVSPKYLEFFLICQDAQEEFNFF